MQSTLWLFTPSIRKDFTRKFFPLEAQILVNNWNTKNFRRCHSWKEFFMRLFVFTLPCFDWIELLKKITLILRQVLRFLKELLFRFQSMQFTGIQTFIQIRRRLIRSGSYLKTKVVSYSILGFPLDLVLETALE